MFPSDSRYGHRRSRAESSGDNHPTSAKVPIPVGVTLHNVMAQSIPSTVSSAGTGAGTSDAVFDNGNNNNNNNNNSTGSSVSNVDTTTKWFRPQHEINLLPKLKLEVLVDTSSSHAPTDKEEELSSSGNSTVASSTAPATTQTPRVVYSSPTIVQSVQPTWDHLDERITLQGDWWLEESIYPFMKLRFTQILSHNHSSNIASIATATSAAHSNFVFLEIPLYPPKLERLPSTLPEALPPNACLIYFSDGSTRMAPSQFSVLLESQLTQKSPIEDFSRFEDDVFRHLDGIQPNTFRQRTESISALLEPQLPTTTTTTVDRDPELDHGDIDTVVSNDLIDEFDAAATTSSSVATTATTTDNDENKNPDTENIPFDYTEQDQIQSDLDLERKRLESLILQEEALQKEELSCFEEERKALAAVLREAKDMEQHITLVRAETKNLQLEVQKDEFLREAQQMKLLRELQTIYPITLDSQKGYLIRNLRLPVDIITTAVPEEEISAALGYCCHLMFMIAKYLGIGLRYRLFCNSSRSAIQYDAVTFLPLFVSRSNNIEREQVDRGMALLGANADCILMTHGIEFTPKSHILARLKRVFDHMVRGQIIS